MNQIDIARAIAYVAHKGQTYGKDPYIVHVLNVARLTAERGGTYFQIAAAWLHDVVEDTSITLEDLSLVGVSWPIREIVEALTRRDGEIYLDYIERVSRTGGAIAVKIADLEYHLSQPKQKNFKRYTVAREYLLKVLADQCIPYPTDRKNGVDIV